VAYRGLSPDERTLDYAGAVAAALLFGFGALNWFQYRLATVGAALTIVSLMVLATPLVGRRGVDRINWMAAWVLVGIGFVSFLRGGLILTVLWWTLLPPIALHLIGRRRQAAWLAVAVVALVGFLYLLESNGLTPERKPATLAGALIAGIILVIVLLLMALSFRRAITSAEEERLAMERRLFQANKLEGIARLAGGVAHDFNNLLAVIASRARVVAEELGPDHGSAADLSSIMAATESGSGLTRRLLAIGREGEVGVRRVPTDVAALMRDAADLLRGGLPDDVVLNVEAPSSEVVIEADPQRIHQVMMNLAINSRDAMPHGGRLDIEVRSVDLRAPRAARYGDVPAGAWVVLEVRDTGEGMDEEVLDRMLEPFFTTKGRDEGSGLGLAVVHGIVEGLGGRLDVTSKLGVGTSVKLYLPHYHGSSSAPVKRAPMSSAPYEPVRILLVEDDAAVRKATQRLLRLDGHDVILASSGSEALELLESSAPDVLVTDVVMPEMSGPDLARRAKRRRPELGVIYLSGYPGDVLKQEDLASDSVFFLQKPASRELINETISELTRKQDRAVPRP